MIGKKLFCCFAITLLCFAGNAHANDEVLIATIDVNKILGSLDEAKSQKEKFEKERQKIKKAIESKQASLKKLEDKLKSKKADPAAKDGVEFRAKVKDFQRYVKDKEEELKRDFFQANQKLGKMVFKAIEDYAQKNDIDLVLEKSTVRSGPVLFGTKKADITDEVLASLK